MNIILIYLKCGSIYINRETASYNVYSNELNINRILPFYSKYAVMGYKNIQFVE